MTEQAHTQRPTPTVFVSYSRDDEDSARRISDLLVARGISVWWDALIGGGERFADIIEERLETADRVVVLWSARFLKAASSAIPGPSTSRSA